MTDRDTMYEGDGIIRHPAVSDPMAEYERRARRLRALYIGSLLNRLFDWFESLAQAVWRRRTEQYLAQATDLPDLERRMRRLERRGGLFG